jgi:hypothetical protein
MTHQWKQVIWAMAAALSLMASASSVMAEEQEEYEEEPAEAFCPASQGSYKNSDEWPVSSMYLGEREYDESELRAILDAPTRGDASIILARQLIAAELNVAAGHNASVFVDADNRTAAEAIAEAHALVGDQQVPAKVRGKDGADWTALADTLDAFNNGHFTEGCFEEESEEESPEEGDDGREEDDDEPAEEE